RCISIKKSLVEADERETSLRQLLNFGHTIGHGIEKLSSYTVTHGQAVAKGMIAEARGAYALGLTPNDISGELTEILKEFGFDTSLDYNANDIYKLALKDKKIRDGQINIIVPDSIGKCTLRKLSLPELNELITLGLKQE
ncbi:MAG: 3-dehydroquinate synthase, partial [[Eubacterium] sulci]|nr:3-dehydroquinate synthase [[Eubacterium] sulci]